MEILGFLAKVAAYSMLVAFAMIPAIGFIIGPHFQKVLKVKYDPLDAMDDFPKLGRAGRYSFMIVFGNGMRRSMYRLVYGEYDFRKDARLIDKIISYITWYAVALSAIATVLYGIFWLILKIHALL